jgi:hypothetical protein
MGSGTLRAYLAPPRPLQGASGHPRQLPRRCLWGQASSRFGGEELPTGLCLPGACWPVAARSKAPALAPPTFAGHAWD